jgi:large repetitive protein
MDTRIILIALTLMTANALAQNKVKNPEQSFLQDMDVVNTTRTSLAQDSFLVIKFCKPARNKAQYQFDLYRVEEYYAPNEQEANLKKRTIMAGAYVLITVKEGLNALDIARVFPESMIGKPKRIPNSDTYIVPVKTEPGRDLLQILTAFTNANPAIQTDFDRTVKYIDYDYIVFADIIPNDTHFGKLWALDNNGANAGTSDADIDAVEAWDKTTGNATLVIGIIDTGIDYKHPDLAGNIWENSAEANGKANVDDDNNGYVDDICGWNFYSNTANPRDDHMHGTHVAGTIGALGNNRKGVTGISWKVKMVPLKFLSESGWGSVSGAIAALKYANRVPNLIATSNSWGGGGFTQALKDAIDEAGQRDMLFIAAAGNSRSDNDVYPTYPASYNCANIVSVAATDNNDNLAQFSNYGKNSVHIGAPGVDIYSTVLKKQYGSLSGTSMATPHVTGVVVLVKSLFPALSMQQVRNKILTMGDPKSSLLNKTISGARLNANGSMTATATIK